MEGWLVLCRGMVTSFLVRPDLAQLLFFFKFSLFVPWSWAGVEGWLVLCRGMVTSFLDRLVFVTFECWPALFGFGTGWAGAGN